MNIPDVVFFRVFSITPSLPFKEREREIEKDTETRKLSVETLNSRPVTFTVFLNLTGPWYRSTKRIDITRYILTIRQPRIGYIVLMFMFDYEE